MDSHLKLRYIGWEAKRCYQRNMCIGMGVAIGLCVVAVVIGVLLSGGMKIAMVRGLPGGGGDGDLTAGDHESVELGGVQKTSLPKRVFGRNLAEANRWPVGGFIERYRIVSDWEISPAVRYADGGPKLSLLPEISEAGPGTGLPEGPGYGSGYGEGSTDFGLPEEGPFMPPVRANIQWPESDDDVRMDGGLLSALIEFKGDVRWPSAAKASDTGMVVIAFTIDADACVGDWELIRETPAGLGFARLVKEYLIFNCKYHARIVNGRKVPMRVRLNAVICQDCDQSMVVTRGDLAVQER